MNESRISRKRGRVGSGLQPGAPGFARNVQLLWAGWSNQNLTQNARKTQVRQIAAELARHAEADHDELVYSHRVGDRERIAPKPLVGVAGFGSV